MNARHWLFVFLGLLTAVRLSYAACFELFPDEAYYFMWSERMDLSYFSKGPGVAIAIWLGTHLFGVTEFGVRALSPLLGLGTSLLMFYFARRLYGKSVAIWTALMMNLLPIFNVGSLLMTIDPLSIFFWAAALFTFWLALERGPMFSRWWPLTGGLIGLGFLSKYTNAMQLVSILLILLCTAKYRRHLKRPGFYAMLGVFALCTLPPIIWNARHDWVTLAHLSARGGLEEAFGIDPGEFFTFFGAHFGVYSPLVFGAMLVAIGWGAKKARRHFKPRFLLAFALPLLVLYFALALRQAGEANWTAPATISLGILAVALWHEKAHEAPWARRYCGAALGVALACTLLILNLDLLRAAGLTLPYELDPARRGRGWRTAAAKVEELRARFEQQLGEPLFLIANEHETAASLGFYLRDQRRAGPRHPPIYIPAEPVFVDQFSFWPRYDELVPLAPGQAPPDEYFTEEQGVNPFRGRSALYFTDRAENRPPTSIQDSFQSWELIACLAQVRRGLPLRELRVFVCRNYLDPGVR
ncbi:MAG: glycosyltransferase family 39 protein [Verrucomicrobiota bacterium]|nr:glycosyltransferase family 39 protein [Verrucomicrobiota bacterium]